MLIVQNQMPLHTIVRSWTLLRAAHELLLIRIVQYEDSCKTCRSRRLTAWLRTREGEPPAKCGRQPQDTESDAEATCMSDSSVTLDSASLSSSSQRAHEELLRPREAIAE